MNKIFLSFLALSFLLFSACDSQGNNTNVEAHDDILVHSPQSGDTASCPILIKGEARGPWYFEASFPVHLYDEQGQLIASTQASATEEWMTEAFVPFEVELYYSSDAESGRLVLMRSNASGLPEYDEEVEIPVMLGPCETETQTLHAPIENFESLINFKPFGVYITPQSSPVQPERFTGYHTGIDIEVDTETETPVYAIADGKVELARTVNGYGGVMILSHEIDGETYSVLYGHLDPASFSEGEVKKGQQIAVLGEAYSQETDGERKHLHFSIKPGLDLDLKGYVQNESALSGWVDPISLY